MTLRLLVCGLAFSLAVALGSCSSGSGGTGGTGGTGGSGGGTGEATIGTEGGSLTTTDGRLTLTVPPGALSDATRIEIRPVPVSDAPEAVRALPGDLTVYDLQPPGLQFAVPAQLVVEVPGAVSRTASDLVLSLAFLLSESDGAIEALGNQAYGPSDADGDGATLSSNIEHFSSAIVQFFNGATIGANVPERADVGSEFDVTVTIDIEDSGLDPILQSFLSDFSEEPVALVGDLDETFVGTPTLQSVTNTYTCTEVGLGEYQSLASFVVDNAIGPDTGTQLSAPVDCVTPFVPFEVMDPAPAAIGRAPGSNFAGYSTRNGVTVIDLRNGDVLQRVARSDVGDFPTDGANAYVPDGQIWAVIATQSNGVAGAFFGGATLNRIGFLPEFSGGTIQYAPGRFVSFADTPVFYDIDESGANDIESLNDALLTAGAALRAAYVQPNGFTEGSPLLGVRNTGNPAVDPPELVSVAINQGVVEIEPIPREETPDPLNGPGFAELKCVPDPMLESNAVCGAVSQGASGTPGGIGLFRWIPAEMPDFQIQSIRSRTGGGLDALFISLDVIDTEEGTRFASTNVDGDVRIDDVGASPATTILPTPGNCGTAVDVEFRNSPDSALVSCLDIEAVVTLDLPPFGGGGAGGAGGDGGAGGSGGSGNCVDDAGARPTLTAQPTITLTDPVEGGQVEVGLSVSAETRLVRVNFFDGFGALGGQTSMMTSGSESLSLNVALTDNASNFDYFLTFNLCNASNLDCLTNTNSSSVSYSRGSSTASPGDPYFIVVRDNGVQIIDEGGVSCFELLAIQIADVP